MSAAIKSTPNILLNAIGDDVRKRLFDAMERISHARDMMLSEINEPIEMLYFMEEGVASVVAVEGERRTEVGIIGFEGLVGSAALAGARIARLRTFIQVDGGTALCIGREALRAEIARSPELDRILLAYSHCFMLQVSFAVLSCAEHLMEARLARWLLMCHDRMDGDISPLTHEFMAIMISAQRSGVTMTLHSLEGAGMIRSTRGKVTVLDREKLRELAGESYGAPEAEYRELIGAFGK